MLQQLFIQNFALIDKLSLDFNEGLTVITGETGAGKSILVGALELILGKRVDHASLKDKSRKCIVEGRFLIDSYDLLAYFEEHNLDYAEDTILRREITPNGKSRSFINDTPVTLSVLKMLGNQLIDIHSQRQSIQINDPSFQLSVLDGIAKNTQLRSEYQQTYAAYKEIKDEIDRLEELHAKAKLEEDFLNFQFQELEQLKLQEGESDSLEVEQKRFANSEEIIKSLNQAYQLLGGEGEDAILSRILALNRLMSKVESYSIGLSDLANRVKSISIELEDINAELTVESDSFEYLPERHQFVEERLSEIHRLQQKHLLSSAEELIGLKEEISQKLMTVSSSEEKRKALEQKLAVLVLKLTNLAKELTNSRKTSIAKLIAAVENTLNAVGIPNAKLDVKYQQKNTFHLSGVDEFEFLFSANKGIAPEPISKTASGGEISRLMLAIKRLLADNNRMPTILFDEIDTGVSGDIAEKMGAILAGIGQKRQVISITHLPQLAAKGKFHYLVYKETDKEKSITQVKALNQTERIQEVAKMLSGAKITEAAMNNAKELLVQ